MARWKSAVPSREEQRDLKRAALLREAARAFAKYGFHNVSLDEVARGLQISKPTLYTYYRTKQDLLFACHSLALDLGDQSMAYADEHGGTGLEKIVLLIRHYVCQLTSDLGEMTVLTDLHALLPEHRDEIRLRRDGFDRQLRQWVEQGVGDGSIAPYDPTIAVACFMGAINWLHAWYSPTGPRTGDEIAAIFSGIFGKGLSADGPEGRGAGPRRRR